MRRRLLQVLLFLLLLFVLDRSTAALLRVGLQRYFGLGMPAEVLLVGHSHMMQGLMPCACRRVCIAPWLSTAVRE
ncbi:MAG: hypothetical protein ACI4OX_02510 [Akkermansia sp.]